ncbi:uncharacterized protein LOC108667918 isoform X2 [Hyalella azteca]|uniref:Uncharacterized protein LOC108667918 isoform X1 n=1 Tax=Hyalella azteca TaxID=294128 RepID=A0A8B7NA89_HYAAZ|nr:uncharacterized protein LOC108667918 isoform X1 [Hyalella azteca]XP_018010508.1 uncharacterized protein LOC108667918 isoform X2 [Hyalella azteca]
MAVPQLGGETSHAHPACTSRTSCWSVLQFLMLQLTFAINLVIIFALTPFRFLKWSTIKLVNLLSFFTTETRIFLYSLPFHLKFIILIWIILSTSHIILDVCLLTPVLHQIHIPWTQRSAQGIVFGVFSGRDHFLQRLAVRNTWASDLSHVSEPTVQSDLVFVVGADDCHIHPKLRVPSYKCQAPFNNGSFLANWTSISSASFSNPKKTASPCITGISIMALTDIFLSSVVVSVRQGEGKIKIIVSSDKQEVFTTEPSEFLDGSQVASVQKFLSEGEEVQISVQLPDQLCLVPAAEHCEWLNGSSSVEYSSVELSDGRHLPWSEGLCAPFYLNFENGADKCETLWTQHASHCYSKFYSKKSWHEAAETCRLFDAELASISSLHENTFLAAFTLEDAWIGLSSEELSSSFVWTDGSDVTFTNWDSLEPNNNYGRERCVQLMSRSGLWNDFYCSTPLNFVCKKKRVKEQSLRGKYSETQQARLQREWQQKLEGQRQQMSEELRLYGDLLVVPGLSDDPQHLPLKLLALLQWTAAVHPGYWLFKTDDDVLVNVRRLMALHASTRLDNECGAVVSHFEHQEPVPRFGRWAELQYSANSFPSCPSHAGYLINDEVVSGLASLASGLRTYSSETSSLAVWLSSLTFPCAARRDLDWRQVFALIFGPARVAAAGLLDILEGMFLAKMPVSRASMMSSSAARLSDIVSCAAPARLVSEPCWLRDPHECHDQFVVAPNLSVDQMDHLYKTS